MYPEKYQARTIFAEPAGDRGWLVGGRLVRNAERG
jgi:hypothetical protein